MRWADSNAVRSLLGALVLNALGWASLGVATNGWDWRPLATSTIAILIPFVKRLTDPDVDAGKLLNFRGPKGDA